MAKIDLCALFIGALTRSVPDRKKLAYRIADILKIETESVYRRLAGKVNFSINEMGVIAKEMKISVDTLLNQDADKTSILFELGLNSNSTNMDGLADRLEELTAFWKGMKSTNYYCITAIYDSIPLEFYMFYPHLSKYMYFKWGYYYIGSKEFDCFSMWEIPSAILDAQEKVNNSLKHSTKICYIWDMYVIPNIVNEINYHLSLGILTPEDAELIKTDLHQLLDSFEEFVKRREEVFAFGNIELECYVTNQSIGMTSFSVVSDDPAMCVSNVNSSFLHSALNYDRTTSLMINEWINMIKKVSFLISGSGNKERVLFFKKQHQIVDTVGVMAE